MKYRSVSKSIVSSSVAVVVQLVVQILLVPICIETTGVHAYGEWLVLNSIFAFVGLLDFGMGVSISNECIKLYNNSRAAMNLLIVTSNSLLVISILILNLIFGCCIILFHWVFIKYQISLPAILILLTYYFCNVYLSIPNALYRSIDKYQRGININSIYKVGEFALMVFILKEYHTFNLVVYGMLGLRVLLVLFIYYDVRKLLSTDILGFNFIRHTKKVDLLKTMKPVLQPSKEVFSNSIVQTIGTNALIPFIGLLFGANFIVQFTTIRTLVNSAKMAINVVMASVWGQLSKSYFEMKKTELFYTIKKYEKFSILVLIVFSFTCFFRAEYIYQQWLGKSIELNNRLLFLMLISLFIYSLYVVRQTFNYSINNLKGLTLNQVFSLIVFFFGSAVGKTYFNVELVGVFLIISDLITLLYVYKTANLAFNEIEAG